MLGQTMWIVMLARDEIVERLILLSEYLKRKMIVCLKDNI